MNRDQLQHLQKLGMTVRSRDGRPAVTVSFCIRDQLSESSRTVRRQRLAEQFQAMAEDVSAVGGEVDLGSLSVSGQSVEGAVPIDELEALERNLADKHVSVTLLSEPNVQL